ncbi:MAG TPA: chemotaxis protein CheB [Thermoanaerobaculia bacterium]
METPVSGARSRFDIVAIGSSAGGVEALSRVLSALPADFPAAVVAVHHLSRHNTSVLADVLGRCTSLPVRFAHEDDPLIPGTVLLAPADRHLAIHPDGMLRLTRTARLNFSRPAVDPLLVSVAFQYGPRALGVILTGANGDGGVGAWAIHYTGGVVIVQDTATSLFPQMPESAMSLGAASVMLPLEAIGPAIRELVCGKDDQESGTRT